MGLPLLIAPPGGIKVVASLKLASHLFAPYETAWAWGAKLAAANALSAFEVAALLGVSSASTRPLLPARLPPLARTLGQEMTLPREQIEHAFLAGSLKNLQPFMCDQLRLCPVCARLGYHFLIHQMRPLACCPLHSVQLRECCQRCAAPLAYEFGTSKVHGPISCTACAAPQLAVTRGGYPKSAAMSAKEFSVIARWLAFLQRRSAHSVLVKSGGAIDANLRAPPKSWNQVVRAIVPARSARIPMTVLRSGWLDDIGYTGLKTIFWQHANEHWRRLPTPSHRWYRQIVKGLVAGPAPTAKILAFVYWRMTWQGCANPYLLRRGHGLPLYGIAEWEAGQPSPDADDLDIEQASFAVALEASWRDWLDYVDLLGVKEITPQMWCLRAYPSAYIPLPQRQRKRHTNNFI